jgi:hypothetical protein
LRTTEEATGTARWVRATGALITVAVLAACGSPSSSSSRSSGSSSTPDRVTKTGSLTGVELAVNLKAGTGLTSMHFFISSKAGSKSVLSAQGDEKLANGRLAAMRLNENVGPLNVALLLVDGQLYVKLPSNLNKSGRPWEKATAGSTNPVLKKSASTMSSLEQSASLNQYGSLAQAASP